MFADVQNVQVDHRNEHEVKEVDHRAQDRLHFLGSELERHRVALPVLNLAYSHHGEAHQSHVERWRGKDQNVCQRRERLADYDCTLPAKTFNDCAQNQSGNARACKEDAA